MFSTIKKILSGLLMCGSFFSSSLSAEGTTPPSPLVLVLLGPPGAGKGTQAALLKQQLHLPHISTGELLREHIRQNTPLGKQAKGFMDKGQLVPDQLILDMLFAKVSQPDYKYGYILDGVPRTIPQAESLQKQLKNKARVVVLNFDLGDRAIIERLTQRWVCQQCGNPYNLQYSPPKKQGVCDSCSGKLIQRADDTEAVIAERLKVYHEQTEPLIAFYSKQKLLHTIPANQSKEEIFQKAMAQLPKNLIPKPAN